VKTLLKVISQSRKRCVLADGILSCNVVDIK